MVWVSRISGVWLRQPLLVPLMCLAAGIGIGHFALLPLAGLWLFTLSLTGAVWLLPQGRRWLFPLLLIFIGWTNLAWRTSIIAPNDLRNLAADQPALVTMHGMLVETPETIPNREPGDTPRVRARFDVTAIRFGDEWQPAAGRVLVQARGPLPEDFFTGRQVQVQGVLDRPPPAMFEGLFDYREYLAREDIYFELRTEGAADWKLSPPVQPGTPPWHEQFRRWAHHALGLGLPDDDPVLRLLRAMVLWERQSMPEEAEQSFVQAGTMHLFAVSGLHVGIIAYLFVQLLRAVRLPRSVCGWITVPLLWAYLSVIGWHPSAVRATIMMTVIVVGWSLHRPTQLLNSLWTAALILLIEDPRQLFHPGFQLSFSVVANIAVWLPRFDVMREHWLKGDPFLPESLQPVWQRGLRKLAHALLTCLGISFASWIGSLPLVALYFHLVSPVSLLANLLAVPILAPLALYSCAGSLLCAGWAPGLSVLFNNSAWLWMTWVLHISSWAAHLPGAFFPVATPTPLQFAFYGTLLLLCAAWPLLPKRSRFGGVTLVVLLLIGCGVEWNRDRFITRLYIAALPRGDVLLCDRPGLGDDLLINTGTTQSVHTVVSPLLEAKAWQQVPRVVLTHGDSRQISGVPDLLAAHPETVLVTSPLPYRSPVYRRILAEAGEKHRPLQAVQRGNSLAGWLVLHPQTGDHLGKADDSPLVLQGNIHGTRVLLLANLGQEGQRQLLGREPDLEADLVVAGLPTQGEPLSDELLKAVHPRLIIVPGCGVIKESIRRSLRQRLSADGATVWLTSDTGGVTVEFAVRESVAHSVSGVRVVLPKSKPEF